jgi:hypothetical protein
MMRARLLLFAGPLLGCQSPGQRCQDIQLQSFSNQAYERGEEDFWKRATQGNDYASLSDSEKAKWHRADRFKIDSELRAYIPESTRKLLPPPDSNDPTPQPPPRPTDMRWYDEHSYKGKPR